MQAEKLTKFSTITLSSGRQIPRIGFGTYLLTGQSGVKSLVTALQSGYTHLDTATMYGNQTEIKKAIQISQIQRSKLYITSKVGPDEQGTKKSRDAVLGVIKQIGCQYLDLILIHWPGSYTYQGNDKRNQNLRLQTWNTLIELQKQGKVKDIGVSNFLKNHLQHLFQHSPIRPVINQIQIHPLLWQQQTIQFCRDNGIAVEAYSPLAHNNTNLFKNKVLAEIGEKYKKSIAQVCLRWGLQQNLIILPKSGTQSRIRQNIDIFDFELSQQQMGKIKMESKKNVRTDWNPHSIVY